MTESKDEAQLVVKLPRELRETFVETCKNADTNASREIRAFIRDYVRQHGQAALKLK